MPNGYSSLADIDLLQRVATQDRKAFAELFGRFAPRVKSFLLSWGMPNDQAEEITQEVWVNIWRKASSFDADKAAVSTWIFAIARNRRIDLIRRNTRREPDPNDPLFNPEPEPDGMISYATQQRHTRVRHAFEALAQDQQDVVRLAFFDGLSHAECAERLSLPLGTVKSRIRLAFAKLRDILGEDMAQELYDE